MTGQRNGTFIATKEHRRFVEFAAAVQKHRYIGICFGTAGVGKTMSARRFARWDKAEALLTEWGPRDASDAIAYEALAKSRTVFYTPTVGGPVREVREDLRRLITRAEGSIDLALNPSMVIPERHAQGSIEVLVVDEAERLSTQSLEHVRDIFDRTGIGVILIGMPGLERKLERYPQLYSRIGFAHHYRALKGMNCPSSSPATGENSACNWTPPTLLITKRSHPLPASPAATSGFCIASLSRSSASLGSTSSRWLLTMSSRRHVPRW